MKKKKKKKKTTSHCLITKMCERTIVEGIVKNTAAVAENTNFTYINRLFPELGDEPAIVLVCKEILTPAKIENPVITNLKNVSLEATDLDVTGSPLRHSFGDDQFDITIIGETRNWSRVEENHLPMGKMRASAILNLRLEQESGKWGSPLFVLCDGGDAERTVLVGTFVGAMWFSTMKVCIGGLVGYSKINDCSSLMQEHRKLALTPEREVKVSISSSYEFYGTSRRTIDWSEKRRGDFEGYLGVELSWSTLSFLPPVRAASNHLIAEVAAGWSASPLNELWDQLLLLDKYLSILESYQKKNLSSRYSVLPLKFPNDFDTPYLKRSNNIMEKLSLLLSGDDAFEDYDNGYGRANERPFENDTDLDDNALLRNYLSELSSRQNLDFSDQLWQLVIGSNDYAQMTDCIHTVFEEIVENNYKPQINGTDSTRFAKLVSELNSSNAVVPSLAGSLPLELVIDMGMEKMSRDYTYLLLSANLAELYDMRQKLSKVSTGEFSVEKYRAKLMTMARIHLCLEFLLLVQNNLDCSLDTSHSFFNYALKLYTSDESPVKSFADLLDNTIYTLKAPGSNAILKEISKVSPTSWRGTLSSSQRSSKFTTTTHYSKIPIFPPNIYMPGDPCEGEESFHVTAAVSCSYKIN